MSKRRKVSPYKVACPRCGAGRGERCRRKVNVPHAARGVAANGKWRRW